MLSPASTTPGVAQHSMLRKRANKEKRSFLWLLGKVLDLFFIRLYHKKAKNKEEPYCIFLKSKRKDSVTVYRRDVFTICTGKPCIDRIYYRHKKKKAGEKYSESIRQYRFSECLSHESAAGCFLRQRRNLVLPMGTCR